MQSYEGYHQRSTSEGKYWVTLIIPMCTSRITIGLLTTIPNRYTDDADETRVTEKRKGMWVYPILDYSGIMLLRSECAAQYAKRKHARQKSKLNKSLHMTMRSFLGLFVSSHFVFKLTKCAYRWLKTWPQLSGGCWNMAAVYNHEEPCVMGRKCRWKDQWKCDNWKKMNQNQE